MPKPESHVKVTGCWFWDGFQDGILAVSRKCRGAARGVPKRLVIGTDRSLAGFPALYDVASLGTGDRLEHPVSGSLLLFLLGFSNATVAYATLKKPVAMVPLLLIRAQKLAEGTTAMSRTTDYCYCPYDGNPLTLGGSPGQERFQCSRCGFVDYQNPRPCVCFLILKGRDVLLARRAIEPAKNMWDIPGGFVDSGESAEQAVIREALEETSLRVRIREYFGSLPDIYGDREVPTLNFCFLAEIVSGELRAQSDVAELQWVGLDCLPGGASWPSPTSDKCWNGVVKRVCPGSGVIARSGPH